MRPPEPEGPAAGSGPDLELLSSELDRLLELTPEARCESLGDWERRDPRVHCELVALLADLEAAEELFPDPEAVSEAAFLDREVAGFRLVSLLGRGGMGQVYLGEREGDGYVQKVAVKILALPWAGPRARRQFRQEVRILARLEHPNLARFIDGGVTGDGVSFVVMELVEGEPLDQACRKADLDVVLDRCEQLVEVVAFAHRHLVIHRDIKPANVMVTAEGRVKLLDFGISKILQLDDDSGEEPTRHLALTPRYASPEQLRGEPLTTSTDVYALGAVLYELLSGTRFPERRKPDDTVPRPSRAIVAESSGESTTGRRRSERLRGDLDAIVTRALAVRPDDRYASARELLDDLRRYRGGLPVVAREPSWIYLAGKWIGRHRVSAVLGAVAICCLVLGVSLAVLGGRRAAEARDQAVRALQEQKVLSTFLIDLFEAADSGMVGGQKATVDDLLDQGLADAESGLAAVPGVRAEVKAVLGRILMRLSRYQEALELLEAWAEARPEPEPGRLSDWLANQEIRAESLIHLGNFEPAREILEENVRRAAAHGDLRAEGSAYSLLGLAGARQGDFERAERYFARSLEQLASCGAEPCGVEWVQTLLNRGNLWIETGELDAAERDLLEARRLEETVVGREILAIGALSNLAVVYTKSGRLEEAAEVNLELLELKKDRLGAEAPKIGITHQNLAHTYLRMQSYERARFHFEEAFRLFSGHDDQYPAFPLAGLARLSLEEGKADEAVELATKARELLLAFHEEDHFYLAQVETVLGSARAAAGDPAEGAEILLAARAKMLQVFGPENPAVQEVERSLEVVRSEAPPAVAAKIEAGLR